MEDSIAIPLEKLISKFYIVRSERVSSNYEIDKMKMLYERVEETNPDRIKWNNLLNELQHSSYEYAYVFDAPVPAACISLRVKTEIYENGDKEFNEHFIYYSSLLPVYTIFTDHWVDYADRKANSKRVRTRYLLDDQEETLLSIEKCFKNHFPHAVYLPHAVGVWNMPGLRLPECNIGDPENNVFSALFWETNFTYINIKGNPNYKLEAFKQFLWSWAIGG